MPDRLIDYRSKGFSQSGEEGIIRRIFEILGIETGLCCEFGAWDGVYLSNTRALMLQGWQGLMIEADPKRFEDLKATYPEGSKGICAREFVDSGENSLARIAERNGITDRFDFVNIDIDGLDYAMFQTLSQFPRVPLVACIEAHTCHRADDEREVPPHPVGRDPGQPLGLYMKTAKAMGYRLVCYLATNAFFIHEDAGHHDTLPTLSAEEATAQNLALIRQDKAAREYLYRVNLGLEGPFYRFGNPMFSARSLGISPLRAFEMRFLNRPASV